MQHITQTFVLLYEVTKIILSNIKLLMCGSRFGSKYLLVVIRRNLKAMDNSVSHIHNLFEQNGNIGVPRLYRYGVGDIFMQTSRF